VDAGPLQHGRADYRVEPGSISAAGQNSNSHGSILYCLEPPCASFTEP
jgi:hypothetical protein